MAGRSFWRVVLVTGLWVSLVAAARAGDQLEKVAVMPVCIVNADRGNGEAMTRALEANLKRHGCELVPQPAVQRTLADLGVNLEKPVFLVALTQIGRRASADVVVYTRALVQGPTVQGGLIDRGAPALILHVMVVDCRSGELLVTNEIFQEWRAADPTADEQTVTQKAADDASERLLSKLYLPISVTGQLVDAETGRPIPEAEAFLQQEGAETRVTLTDERGEFSFTQMARGTYTLSTHAPRHYDVARVVPFSLGDRRLVLSLAPRAAALTGVLRDGSGAPVARQSVQILDRSGKPVATLTTLTDGSFGQGSLKAGVYSVVVVLPSGTRLEKSAELKPGDVAVVELRAP